VRLDHLLSKEHHEMGEASGLARAVRSRVPVVGAGLVHNNESPVFFMGSGIAKHTVGS
jgi:hypothetical protein